MTPFSLVCGYHWVVANLLPLSSGYNKTQLGNG